MKLFEIEKQIKELQAQYESTCRKDIKEELAYIGGKTDNAAENEKMQREYLMGLIMGNSATWSGGAASVSNMLETINRDIAINLMQALNRGFL